MAEPIQDYVLKHVFDVQGYTGGNYYYRIMNRTTSQIWNNTTKTLVAQSSLPYEDGCIALASLEDGDSDPLGIFQVMFFKEMPGGVYSVTIHRQDGGDPKREDDLMEQWQQKHGSIFGF